MNTDGMVPCKMCWGEGVTMDDHFERNHKRCPMCRGAGFLEVAHARALGLENSTWGVYREAAREG